MKKLLFILLVVLCSCESKNITQTTSEHIIDGVHINIYVIDSCEYLGSPSINMSSAYLTHKGNCKFCKSRNQK